MIQLKKVHLDFLTGYLQITKIIIQLLMIIDDQARNLKINKAFESLNSHDQALFLDPNESFQQLLHTITQ